MNKLIAYHFPYIEKNPYQMLMFKALNNTNIISIGINNGIRGLLSTILKKDGSVLHLHWIHKPVLFKSFWGALFRLCIFHFSVFVWLFRGKKVVWTIHNIVNHEGKRQLLDRLHSRMVAREVHQILVHGESIIPLISHEFRVSGEKIQVVNHGNYENVVSTLPIRNNLKDGVRLLFFGAIRPYKGVLDLLKAFAYIPGLHKLHIAGETKNKSLKRQIEVYAAHDADRISLDLQFISDEELERLLGWCDVVVLPYKDILTSGSLLMAMTAGRPVIAPRAGLIPEYIDDQAAFLYDPHDEQGLEKALKRAVNCKTLPAMAERSLKRSKDYDWNRIGVELARIYQE